MTRFDYIQHMTIEKMAEAITGLSFTDVYCKSNCEECDNLETCECLPESEMQCCIRWLNEEMEVLG